jgi:hypothetical protein
MIDSRSTRRLLVVRHADGAGLGVFVYRDRAQLKLGTARTIVAGVALAIGGLLLIIATRWGRFG